MECRTVSNALEKSKEMTMTNGLDCSKLVMVCSKEMIAADVEPAGQKAN